MKTTRRTRTYKFTLPAEKQTIKSNIRLELLKDIITPFCVNVFKFVEKSNGIEVLAKCKV